MKIQPTPTITTFPVLIEAYEPDPTGYYWVPPSDVFQATYVQGEAITQDRILDWKPLAAAPEVSEEFPCFADQRPGYVLDETLLVDGEPVLHDDALLRASFSPDGSRLAYLLRQGEDQLVVARGDGTESRSVPYPGSQVSDFHFSPDGHELWLTCGQIYRIRLDDDTLRCRHVPTTRKIQEFALAPDGKSIAFIDDIYSLRTVTLKTGEERWLAWLHEDPKKGHNGRCSPMFTPDASRIVYNLCESDEDRGDGPQTRSQLSVIASQGGEPFPLDLEDYPFVAGVVRSERLLRDPL